MPRDGSGVYTLPAGNPVVTNTTIASTWANTTLSDIAAQLNNVFTRDGLLGPTGPFKLQDGTVAAPGLAWNSEPALGWYRSATSTISIASGGSQIWGVSGVAPNTYNSLFPRGSGITTISLFNGQDQANVGQMFMSMSPDGFGRITTQKTGTGAANGLLLNPANGDVSIIGHPHAQVSLVSGAGGSAVIYMRKQGSATANNFVGYNDTNQRWLMQMGNETAETGSNAGSDFALYRYSDASAQLGQSIFINRANGGIFFTGVTTVAGNTNITGTVGITGTTNINGNIAGTQNCILTGSGSYNWNATSGANGLVSNGFVASTYQIVNILNLDSVGPSAVHRMICLMKPGLESLFQFNVLGTNFSMYNSGQGQSAGGWIQVSDRRKKTDIQPIEDALAKLSSLVGCTFYRQDMKDINGVAPRKAGYIAQDVQAVLPEAVTVGTDEDQTLAVDHNGVLGLVIESIKTLNDRLTALETA